MTDKNRIKRSKEQSKNKESIRTDGKRTMSEIAEDFKKIPESEFEHDPETKKMIEEAMKPKPEPERATMKMIAKEQAKIDGDVPSLLDEYKDHECQGCQVEVKKDVSEELQAVISALSDRIDMDEKEIIKRLNL